MGMEWDDVETNGLLQPFETSVIATLVELRQRHWKECTNVINSQSSLTPLFLAPCLRSLYIHLHPCLFLASIANLILISFCRHTQTDRSTPFRHVLCYFMSNVLDFESGLSRVNSEKADLVKYVASLYLHVVENWRNAIV